ncbi:MAG TPA: NAD(P)-dependent oxidoreductase [Gemmatimonadaceae bacterium]
MSLIPLGFQGESINVLVVGGGHVGTRRALALLEAGARVRVIGPEISAELEAESLHNDRLSLERRQYSGDADVAEAALIVAATASAAVNERIARDARAANRAVNVADAPDKGSFVFLATHRAGPITIGVSTGGVPNAAGRIRDSIAKRIDSRYADAVAQCGDLRERVLAGSGPDAWRMVAADLINETFCENVEQGTFTERAARWR